MVTARAWNHDHVRRDFQILDLDLGSPASVQSSAGDGHKILAEARWDLAGW